MFSSVTNFCFVKNPEQKVNQRFSCVSVSPYSNFVSLNCLFPVKKNTISKLAIEEYSSFGNGLL